MGIARLIVIEGPDLGREFDIPLRGGGIGRGEGNIVQLSDASVSRSHCTLELRDGRIALVDDGSRNRTLVNGEPVRVHVLTAGDEIAVGKTRLSFLPGEHAGATARPSLPARVTMEVGTRELLSAAHLGRSPTDDRAQRHLAAIASLGDGLRALGDEAAVQRAAVESLRAALTASRAFVLVREPAGRMRPAAAAIAAGDSEADLSVPRPVLDKVLGEGSAISLETNGRQAVAAPILGAGDAAIGVLYADRTGSAWDRVDLLACGCVAHLLAAALLASRARHTLEQANVELEDRLGARELVGSSDGARAIAGFIAKVAPSEATVLLTGESGSGKEMVARALHRASRRQREPFVAVNCAALTETLIESELFGHEKGAFTGATDRKLGRFETAHRGTLFLDEVGELPLGCQTKFLRVLEEQVFERVGGTKSIAVDVRVVAATNRDLSDMARRGTFREDLFYRLSVIHTVVPPLRDRASDIPELAHHFLAKLQHQVSRRVHGFSEGAMRALIAHSWPGNVRELRNAIERALVLGDGAVVERGDLPPELGHASAAPLPRVPLTALTPPAGTRRPTPPAGVPLGSEGARPKSLRELEREGIVAALSATNGNKVQAAQILEIDRSTLYKKLKDYEIG